MLQTPTPEGPARHRGDTGSPFRTFAGRVRSVVSEVGCRPKMRDLPPRDMAGARQRRCREYLLPPPVHEPVEPHVHASRLPGGFGGGSGQPPARGRRRSQRQPAARDHDAGSTQHRDRSTADHGGGSLASSRLPRSIRSRGASLPTWAKVSKDRPTSLPSVLPGRPEQHQCESRRTVQTGIAGRARQRNRARNR
jgi:hypothetical protein